VSARDAFIAQRFERSRYFRFVETAHQRVVAHNAAATADGFPRAVRGAGGFWQLYSRSFHLHLQRHLTRHHQQASVRDLCVGNRPLLADLKSASSRAAGRWLSAPPAMLGRQQLTNQQFAIAMRQRLHLPLFDGMPTICACSKRIDSPAQHGHVHWCSKTKVVGVTLRHNHVLKTLAGIAERAGITTRIELTQPSFDAVARRGRALRPDLLLVGCTGTIMVDVGVTHPTAPSRIKSGLMPHNASDDTLHVIQRTENLKVAKYRSLAGEYGARFVPFVCDVFGGIGTHGLQLVDWICSEYSASSLADAADSREFRRAAFARLSAAIQRGAAAGAVDAARRIRSAAARRVDVVPGVAAASPSNRVHAVSRAP
jgi:hypothetical protein